jgi:hypothetical protein
MCGTDSVNVVAGSEKVDGEAVVVTSTKFLFTVDENGEIGHSHSEARSMAKLPASAKTVNIQPDGEGFDYENGTPRWYTKALATKTEAKFNALLKSMKKLGPAYAKSVAAAKKAEATKNAAAKVAYDKAVQAAATAMTKKLGANAVAREAAKKTAFAPIAKLGGIAK